MLTTQNPSVTVVMPLHNKEAEVCRAVKSVLSQSIVDFELIVVNDGSTDNGATLVESFRDPRVKVVHQSNAGVSGARNRGIQEARAELIAFLDADDEWKPFFLSTVVDLKREFPECSVFATGYVFSDANGQQQAPIIRGISSSPWKGTLDRYFAIAAKSDPPIWSSAVAVEKKALQAVGLFPVGVTSGEDLLTWAKLATRYKIAYSTVPCAIFHRPLSVLNRPKRAPAEFDVVGQELTRLLADTSSEVRLDLERYIALWHKMRCVFALQVGNRRMSLDELQLLLKCEGHRRHWYLFGALAFLPPVFTGALLKLRGFLRALRKR